MFGAGWTEMLIIGVVALVVIGPKDLPMVMAKLGRMVRTVRRMGDEFRRELDKTTGLDQITELRRSITEPLRQTSDEILREFNRQTETGFEPSGIVKPTDPKVESVYDQIAATSGLPPRETAPAAAEPLPAPAEAAPAASKPRRPRKAKAVSEPATPETKPARRTARKAVEAVAEAAPVPASVEAGAPAAPPTIAAKTAPRRRAPVKAANGGSTSAKPARTSKARAKSGASAAPEAPRLPAEEA